MSDLKYPEALREAEELSKCSDDALLERLGLAHPGHSERWRLCAFDAVFG